MFFGLLLFLKGTRTIEENLYLEFQSPFAESTLLCIPLLSIIVSSFSERFEEMFKNFHLIYVISYCRAFFSTSSLHSFRHITQLESRFRNNCPRRPEVFGVKLCNNSSTRDERVDNFAEGVAVLTCTR